jgi:hypothetical protein
MRCDDAQNLIQRELDGELTVDQAATLAAHVARCSRCRAMRHQHAAIQAALKRIAAATDTNDVAEPAAQPLTFSATPKPHQRWIRTGLAAAAAMALLIGTWQFSNLSRTDKQERTPSVPIVRTPPKPAPAIPPSEVAVAAPEPQPRPDVRVEFRDPDSVIAIRRETSNPNVTILWIYPTIETADAAKKTPADNKQSSTPPHSTRSLL